MPETTERLRRWNGFICPGCRLVFRVRNDQAGQGVTCPCCRRVLRIPVLVNEAGDATVAAAATIVARPSGKRQRQRGTLRGGEFGWDRPGVARRSDGHRMRWMLIGGGTLFVLSLSAVISAMAWRGNPSETLSLPSVAPLRQTRTPATEDAGAQAALKAAAEVARKFLAARRSDEMLRWVRHPEITGPRMGRFYQDGSIPAAAGRPVASAVFRQDSKFIVPVTIDGHERSLVCVESPHGPRVDWEAWVGWSDLPWDEFLAKQPKAPQVLRVHLSALTYYNFDFTDERMWRSYRLQSPDGKFMLYGYAKRGSTVNSRLLPHPDGRPVPVTLSVRYPDPAHSSNQVIIDECLADSWAWEPSS